MNTDVDLYFTEGCGRCPLGGTPNCKVNNWQKELEILRKIILESGLTEESKWGVPTYTFQKNNILILAAFKDYCAVSFFKGALLEDTNGILTKPSENTQAGRLIRFTNVREIIENENNIKAYIFEAIEVEKAGLDIIYKKASEYSIPQEFQQKLDENPALKTAFETLTAGRQKGYIFHFSAPKQSKTRETRVENCIQKILNGQGLND
jgi:uncharacterized protein YdeI (YjbR/CyaY-like superfamily)